jgi:hypothetical protein
MLPPSAAETMMPARVSRKVENRNPKRDGLRRRHPHQLCESDEEWTGSRFQRGAADAMLGQAMTIATTMGLANDETRPRASVEAFRRTTDLTRSLLVLPFICNVAHTACVTSTRIASATA